ncbi:proline and serine-rich protein 2 [Perognathus longimembris pacificus]|uniref:proline and serine-rich protein 2 n=1 Tax=Perognathus longimembris pacificus TaxID=214514 RepID=UPI002019B261|nr:proline and serine-rich protein 2 [Perognathus longimembris pacificus]
MPVNHQKPGSSDMDADMSPSCRPRDESGGGSTVGSRSRAQSRTFSLDDDESLKYLTHEEKDVILFFEETLDSLADDLEETALGDGGVRCPSPHTPAESPASPWEPGEVIDLVQPGPRAGEGQRLPDALHTAGTEPAGKEHVPDLNGGKQDAEPPPASESRDPEPPAQPPALPSVLEPAPPRKELLGPAPPSEHPKLPRSIPTPLVIAQKMSEKLAGSEALSPASPWKEGRPADWRTLACAAPRNGDHPLWHRHPAPPAPKTPRFPSNISVTISSGKDFNKTISKAAVNVQERKAQVLANINGVSYAGEGRAPRGDAPEPGRPGPAGGQQSRAVQTELANGFPSIHEALKSEPSAFVPTGKTITFRPDPALAGKLARQGASRSLYEPQPPDCDPRARRRAGSLPRAAGFRPQGVTVQFSGRGSSEEARREALRKLGLLKENL